MGIGILDGASDSFGLQNSIPWRRGEDFPQIKGRC